jgi:tryptophan halogenase
MSAANQASALIDHDRVFTRASDGAPQMFREFGYHLENQEFVDYLETHASAAGIELIDDKVVEVLQDERGVTAIRLASGAALSADLYVDCSGFASLLLGRALQEAFQSFRATLFCDRAVVGGWNRTTEPVKPYTSVTGMNAGWAWRIEHETRINCGYVYSSDFISDEAAETEFRAAHPHADATRIVRFISGRYQRAWVKNVVAIGNACGFVEPLEATSLGAICSEAAALTEVLADGDLAPTASAREFFNRRVGESWDNIRRFLAIHYKFNTRQQTPFWDACRRHTDLAGAEEIVSFYEDNGPTDLARIALLTPFDQFTMDGWLTLLVGQRVPYRRHYVPGSSEQQLWARIRASVRTRAQEGFTVPEAHALIRSPRWKWNPEFFRAG